MRTAVVHDWLTGMRGGEYVLEEILGLVPDPTVFTLFHFRGTVSGRIERFPIRTSFLQRFVSPRSYRSFLPLFPRAVESFDLSGFDLVVSSSHCVAKGAIPRGAPHLCYCHTPVRYAHGLFDAYFPRGRTRLRGVKKLLIGRLRRWDVATAGRVTAFLANSTEVARRIEEAYGRSARVVPPPVEVGFFTPGTEPARDYALCVGALVPYKRIDRAISWANRSGRGLLVVGRGPEERRLRAMAGSSVQFEASLSREDLRDRYRRCAFFLQPWEEDFGMSAVEAQACGRPVVALARGGARDVVSGPDLGVLYEGDSDAALDAAIDSLPDLRFNPASARENARRFSSERFRAVFAEAVAEVISARR